MIFDMNFNMQKINPVFMRFLSRFSGVQVPPLRPKRKDTLWRVFPFCALYVLRPVRPFWVGYAAYARACRAGRLPPRISVS